jgi:hypothetical protein|tara:strand:- start:269 stop:487 length:219 start_codon:yes stop_codon:yes gene_type:complete
MITPKEAIDIMQHIMKSIKSDEHLEIHYAESDINYLTALKNIYHVMKCVDQKIFPGPLEGSPDYIAIKWEEE